MQETQECSFSPWVEKIAGGKWPPDASIPAQKNAMGRGAQRPTVHGATKELDMTEWQTHTQQYLSWWSLELCRVRPGEQLSFHFMQDTLRSRHPLNRSQSPLKQPSLKIPWTMVLNYHVLKAVEICFVISKSFHRNLKMKKCPELNVVTGKGCLDRSSLGKERNWEIQIYLELWSLVS